MQPHQMCCEVWSPCCSCTPVMLLTRLSAPLEELRYHCLLQGLVMRPCLLLLPLLLAVASTGMSPQVTAKESNKNAGDREQEGVFQRIPPSLVQNTKFTCLSPSWAGLVTPIQSSSHLPLKKRRSLTALERVLDHLHCRREKSTTTMESCWALLCRTLYRVGWPLAVFLLTTPLQFKLFIDQRDQGSTQWTRSLSLTGVSAGEAAVCCCCWEENWTILTHHAVYIILWNTILRKIGNFSLPLTSHHRDLFFNETL